MREAHDLPKLLNSVPGLPPKYHPRPAVKLAPANAAVKFAPCEPLLLFRGFFLRLALQQGGLPMLIQIPIFFGLFTMLRQAVELRNSSFLWIHDLSQPDTVAHMPGLGFPINVLPLLMAGTNVWMMQLTPRSGDPMQQRMMMFMPIIFVVFCYNFAAALSLYYTTQNLLTILQLYQNRRQPMPTLEKIVPAGKKR